MVVTRGKKAIREVLLEKQDPYLAELAGSSLEGFAVEKDRDWFLMVTCPAPQGEPRRYCVHTNTGGRRFVCWY